MTISFIHGGGPTLASYRYRCAFPASFLGASINDPSADTLVFSKPHADELPLTEGKKVVVDFCDDHFARFPHYIEFMKRADLITCSTPELAWTIRELGFMVHSVIPEAYEYPHAEPHSVGKNLLWFGHKTNLKTLNPWLPKLTSYNLRIVCDGYIPWSYETMLKEFARADIVILPATKSYKSPNRAVEAIRQGCWVVAEPHPSLEEFPIWKGNLLEGINHPHRDVSKAQAFIERYSPETVGNAWKKALDCI